MEESETTAKAVRPRLGSRSHTQPTFSSPPKKTSSGLSSIEVQKKHKPHHHLPFFHTSNHDNHTLRDHLPLYKSKKGDESSKTNLRQHLQAGKSVEGLKSTIGEEQGNSEASQRQSTERPSGAQYVRLPNRPIRPEDVDNERQRGKLRETELRQSLNDLSGLATETTRRLDFAFYTVLEKAGQLHSTISSLQELSDSSRTLHQKFLNDSAGVDKDFQGTIKGFDNFSGQKHDVDELVARLDNAKQRTETLSARLEASRRRVELWEAREKEWQKKTSKRLTWSWVCAVAFFVLLVAFIVWKKVVYRTHSNVFQVEKFHNDTLPGFIIEDLASYHSHDLSATVGTSTSMHEALPTDGRLRKLDEL